MDTKYFQAAVDEWCKKHRFEAGLPTTPGWFSDMLRRAQELKEADIARLNADPSAAS